MLVGAYVTQDESTGDERIESHCDGDERIARPREEPVDRRGVDHEE